jgi:hypothetical protein
MRALTILWLLTGASTLSGQPPSGLAANPSPVNITVSSGSAQTENNVNITFNGSPVPITSLSTSGQSWLQAFSSGVGQVTVFVGPMGVSGTVSGTVFVTTIAGQLSLPVNFTVVNGGTLGLFASPNPLNVSVPSGSSPFTTNVLFTFNGAPVTILSAIPGPGQNWLRVSLADTGVLSVTIDPTGFTGTVRGQLTVFTVAGAPIVNVNLTVLPPLPATPAPSSLSLVLIALACLGIFQAKRLVR